jgi:hypothetical protein
MACPEVTGIAQMTWNIFPNAVVNFVDIAVKEGFSASKETLNNPRRRDLPCLMKGN